MGKVHFKFEYNEKIDFPISIEFDTWPAELKKTEGKFEVEGDVGKIDDNVNSPVTTKDGAGIEQLKIYVESSGQAAATWKLSVDFTDGAGNRKLKQFPILKSILSNGYLIVSENFKF